MDENKLKMYINVYGYKYYLRMFRMFSILSYGLFNGWCFVF